MNPDFAGFWQRMNIENKTVLVTGSTDGVGRLVACRLADQGARVLIHGRDRTRGEQLLKEIGAANRGSAAYRRCGRLKDAPDDDAVRTDDVVILIALSAGANSLSFLE